MNRLKLISRSDLSTLHRHYLKYPPYSDFNVVSLWGYMVPGARYMEKNGSILYEMTDYNNNKKYFSILGGKSTKTIIRKLAKRTTAESLIFSNVPESTCKALEGWAAIESITPDEDNHDYIFSVKTIAKLSSEQLAHKKKSLLKLKRLYPNLQIKRIYQHRPADRRAIYQLFKRWVVQSGSTDWHREYRALQRALKLDGFEIVCLGAYDGKKLVGFTINEIEKNGYYQGHYGKADYNYSGLGLYLENETAIYMAKHYNSRYINLQQDMGIEGIRYYKSSLGPLKQLKKFTVKINTATAVKS